MGESINYYTEKIKPFMGLLFVILFAFLAVGMWQLHALASSKTPLKIVNLGQNAPLGGNMGTSQNVIVSKTGTKYYLPWCGALKRINPENQISFATPALARQAGYQPASNCKGVK
jgi:hypothetical protein